MYHRIKKSVYLTVSLTPRLERRLNLPDSGTATEVKLDRPWQVIVLTAPVSLTRISHRFLLNGYKCMYERGLCNLARNRSSFGGCSAETSKRQAREAVLSLRSAWSRARARSRRGSRSALPRIASRICETSGLMSYVVMVFFRVFGYSPEGARQHMLTLPGHLHLVSMPGISSLPDCRASLFGRLIRVVRKSVDTVT